MTTNYSLITLLLNKGEKQHEDFENLQAEGAEFLLAEREESRKIIKECAVMR